MSNEKPNTDELHDRLLDGGLRELIGGETPPDLSEQILFAATGEQAEKLSTRAIGDKAMTAQHTAMVKKRRMWVGLTLAASLLVAASLLWPTMQAARESAKSAQPVPHQLNQRVNVNAYGTNDKLAEESGSTEIQLPEFELAPIDSIVEVEDNGTVLSSGIKPRKETLAFEPQLGDQSKPTSSLMMEVTPRTIIEGEEPEDLGVDFLVEAPQESTGGQRFRADASPGKKGLQELTTDAYGLPSSSPIPPSANTPASTDGPAQPSAKPTTNYRRSLYSFYKNQSDLGGRGGRTEHWGFGNAGDRGPLGWRGDLKRSGGQQDSGVKTRGHAASRELRKKIDRYQQFFTQFDGGESPIASTALNVLLNKVRKKQAEIFKAKQELIDIGVAKTVAEQQARSKSTVEAIVQEELGKDPAIANFRADKLAIQQQIRSFKQRSKQGTSREVKRLEATLKQLDQEAESYRLSREVELRKTVRSAPNDFLAQELTEYVLRRDLITKRIAKLEREYGEAVAAIKQKGELNGELALLEAEIEQLQTMEGLEQGIGPRESGDKYQRIYENPFIEAEGERAVSTFSIDVDTAAYANVRQFLMRSGQLPPPDAVRIEELVNYFDYDYTAPTGDTPFAAHVEVAGCPWRAGHRLVRVGIKGRAIDTEKRPQSNLVFLIDVSGSMNEPAKLPLLVEGMKMLTRELSENDRVAIVVYASSEGLALPSTRGDKQDTILAALEKLRAGGSTAGGAGIELAYKIAKENFVEGGVNRVILATDGDFNVGTTSTSELVRVAETNAKETGVFLTVLGFGRGNLNDSMMEQISGKGNGNYYYVDNRTEARKVLVAELAGTLVTIAKDVKIQIEFNPAQVAAYRLIGYENRMLQTQDFNDDKKDAGEIGAGHTVTAIYELVPAGKEVQVPGVDPLKYQRPAKPTSDADASQELLTLKLRYKQPAGDVSTKVEFPITDSGQSFAEASDDLKFASAVASFGMLLRNSEHQGNTSYSAVQEIAEDGVGKDKHGYRAEFLQMVQRAKELAGE